MNASVWSPQGSRAGWPLKGALLSVPTDSHTWVDKAALNLVVQAGWVTPYCDISKRHFITQCLINFARFIVEKMNASASGGNK